MSYDHPAAASDEASHQHRTLWISDVHLGTKDCSAVALLNFLKYHDAQTIYLVGDIIDGWQLRKRWFWPQTHNDVIQKLLRKARKGTRIVYIPGNHDEFIRGYLRQSPFLGVGGVEIVDEAVHITADGKRMWVLHGDLFDGVVQNMKWLARLGDELYMLALKINRWLNNWRARMGFEYWSLSQYLKNKVKNAVSYIDNFEQAVASEAERRGCDAVLCGHIHRAQIRQIGTVTYLNSGDWVESLTAIAEDFTGKLSIIEWGKNESAAKRQMQKVLKQAAHNSRAPADAPVPAFATHEHAHVVDVLPYPHPSYN